MGKGQKIVRPEVRPVPHYRRRWTTQTRSKLVRTPRSTIWPGWWLQLHRRQQRLWNYFRRCQFGQILDQPKEDDSRHQNDLRWCSKETRKESLDRLHRKHEVNIILTGHNRRFTKMKIINRQLVN